MYQGGVSFIDTVTGNWNMPSPPPELLIIDDDVQNEAVNLVGPQCETVSANTLPLLPLDMWNKNEAEPDLENGKQKKDLDQNMENPKMDSDVHMKKDCDQEVDNRQTAPDQEMDLGQDESQQKVDSDVPSQSTPSQKIECTTTHTDQRSSRPRKRTSPSSRCLRSSVSVCNKKEKKEHLSHNSQKAGKNVYDLSDLIRGKGHRHAKPQTKPKQKSKPKTEKSKKKLKSEKKKKTKPDEQKDKVESDHKEDADTKNTTPHSDIENLQQNTETEKVEDRKDPSIKSDKETESEQQQSAEKKREAKPTGLIEPAPILKAFANVHTMDQALELLDISDEDKPKKSIAVESEIDTGIGIMKVQEYGLKQLNKKDRKFSCSYEGCDEFFPTQGQLNKHLQAVHKAAFKCSKCDKSYDTANGLNKHYHKHFKFSNVCSVCGKTFQFPKQLKTHEGKHTDSLVGKYVCPTGGCNKVLLSKQGLEAHHKIHEAQEFPCNLCDKKFNTEYRLK